MAIAQRYPQNDQGNRPFGQTPILIDFVILVLKCSCWFSEVELSFPYRDVQIKRGVDAKQFYDLESEIGRYVSSVEFNYCAHCSIIHKMQYNKDNTRQILKTVFLWGIGNRVIRELKQLAFFIAGKKAFIRKLHKSVTI